MYESQAMMNQAYPAKSTMQANLPHGCEALEGLGKDIETLLVAAGQLESAAARVTRAEPPSPEGTGLREVQPNLSAAAEQIATLASRVRIATARVESVARRIDL